MGIDVRPTTELDYDTLVALWNESFPSQPIAAAGIALEDRHRNPDLFFVRLLVEHDGRPRAFGSALQRSGGADRREYALEIAAGEGAREAGLDGLVYEALMDRLAPQSPHRLLAWAREDFHASLRFWGARGFEIAKRSYESVLELASIDRRHLEALEAEAKASLPGLTLVSLAAWLDRDGEDSVQRALYDLHTTLDTDVPTVGALTPPPFDEFVRRHFEDPRIVPDAFIVAKVADGGSRRPIALTEVYEHHHEGRLETGLTGVLRGYRRRGVASAVKARSLLAARAAGFARVHTWNAEENRGIRAVNERFGFRERPVMFDLSKDLDARST